MIAEAELETALRALHDAFELERPEPVDAVDAGRRRPDERRAADDARSSPAASTSRASARRTTSSATGWPPGRRRSASRSPTSRRPAAGATAGRWVAPPGAALLLSLGFRPTWLAPGPGLAAGGDRLARDGRGGRGRRPACRPARSASSGRTTWSSSVPRRPAASASSAGVLGETDGLGTRRPAGRRRHRGQRRLGRGRLPAGPRGHDDLAPRGSAGGRVDRGRLARRVPRPPRGRASRRSAAGASTAPAGPRASSRPAAIVRLERPRRAIETVRALGVDAATGALVVADADATGRRAPGPRRRDPPRPARPSRVAAAGVTTMARPALRRGGPAGGGRSAPRPSRPRPSARRGGPGGPGPVRGPVSEVPGPGVQLRVLRAPRPSRGGGRHRARRSWPP